MSKDLYHLLQRIETLLIRIEQHYPIPPPIPDWQTVMASRWHPSHHQGQFLPIQTLPSICLQDLQGIDQQKQRLIRNTEQFLQAKPANHALLWGAAGIGKSSLIKALLNQYASQGLRLIEVDKKHLLDLPTLVSHFYSRPEYFIIFSDDLSFEEHDPDYKSLKSVLEGTLNALPENVLIYATSNRRHLMPETHQDNADTHMITGEIHPAETVAEKLSLSERFGLWLSFYPFNQEDYLRIVWHWLAVLNVPIQEEQELRTAALQWALARGSRSGRSAWQFAKDWAGQHLN